MHFVYIIYSESIDKFYIGETHDINLRVSRHNSDYYPNKWSKKGQPWGLFFSIQCDTKTHAILIEKHIKKMKSRKYIINLKLYPDIASKLIERFR